ncbi:MAG: hypothetical protein IIC67_08845 [Thaumarchaeota archaeon]|nr:hypothetical protein [Nitrososphaerota archaeon]
MSEEKLDQILNVLTEISKWTKFQGLEKFQNTIEKILQTDEEKAAYELSNGIRSSRDIGQEIGLSKTTVTDYWKKWSKIGIVEESKKYRGRMRHFVSLDEIGIEIPAIAKKESKLKTTMDQTPTESSVKGENKNE